MAEQDYSKREIDRMFAEIASTLKDHGETHDKILAQVTFTNGKVRRITIALTALAFFSLGVGLKELAPVLKLFLAI